MTVCSHCGAPLRGASGASVLVCSFCGAETRPPPAARVEVVVSPVVAVVPARPAAATVEGSEPASFACPRCNVRLVQAEAEGLVLHGCAMCGGIWLDNAGTRTVVEQGPLFVAQLARRAANNACASTPRTGGVCPACSGRLHRTGTMDIALDICPAHGTWFDASELALLVEHVNRSRRAREAKEAEARIACIGCKKHVPASETMVTQTGVACEACYRAAWRTALARSNPD